MIVIALLLPPLAVLFTRPSSLLANLLLCLLGWIPGIIHAVLLVMDRKQERRIQTLSRSLGSR